MTETPDPAPEGPLSDRAVAAAEAVAEWCEARREEAERSARAQIRVVWLLLLGGLVLLLVLPRLVQEIDFLWRETSLPPALIQTAERTQDKIETNRAEMEADAADAGERAAALQRRVDETRGEAGRRAEALETGLSAPLALWRDAAPGGEEREGFSVESLLTLPNGGWIAGGSIRGEDGAERSRVAALVLTEGPGESRLLRLAPDGEPIEGEVLDLARGRDGAFVAAGVEGDLLNPVTLLLHSPDGFDWRRVGPRDRNAAVSALVALPQGGFAAAGQFRRSLRGGDEILPLVLRSEDGRDWTPSPLGARGGGAVSVRGAALDGEGRLLLAGRVQPGLAGAPGRAALSRPAIIPVATGEADGAVRTPLEMPGGFNGIRLHPDGALHAFGERFETGAAAPLPPGHPAGRALIAASRDGESWSPLPLAPEAAPPGSEIEALVRLPDGAVLAAGRMPAAEGGRAPTPLLIRSADGEVWERLAVPGLRGRALGTIDALAVTAEGRVLVGGISLLRESLLPAEARAAARAIVEGGAAAPPDLILPPDADAALAELQRLRDRAAQLADQLAQARDLLATAEASLNRQVEAAAEFATVSEELEKALRTADSVRQAGLIATRLAVIALIVYLVQIVVNRYRYLQRLSGFYQARAQAFRLLAASAPDRSLLRGVSLADLTAMLSPDAIGFDKTAEPPTNQMVSLLQAGLRRG
jgi:hypothetical protein